MITRPRATRFRPDLSGWRRVSTLCLFALLGFLQGLAPLLHAHVVAAAATIQSGVHLPVAIEHASHHGVAVVAACAGADESGIVTVPPEIRRDRPLAVDLPCVIPTSPSLATPASITVDIRTTVVPDHAGISSVGLPPAHGPPVTV